MIVFLHSGVEKITHTGTSQNITLFSYCSDFFYEEEMEPHFLDYLHQ